MKRWVKEVFWVVEVEEVFRIDSRDLKGLPALLRDYPAQFCFACEFVRASAEQAQGELLRDSAGQLRVYDGVFQRKRVILLGSRVSARKTVVESFTVLKGLVVYFKAVCKEFFVKGRFGPGESD